ncbi:hypothetical protein JCM11251_002434 [Rhodosporidiobolus azoricus]
MAKTQQKAPSEPTPSTNVPNRDAHQRLNYLYQASILLSTVLPSQRPIKAPVRRTRKGKERSIEQGESEQRDEGGEVDEQDRGEGTSARPLKQEAMRQPRQRKPSKKTTDALKPVSRRLAKEMADVAKKATIRMDPNVKRTKCKGCGAVLIPGLTSSHPVLTPTSSFTSAINAKPAAAFPLLLISLPLHQKPTTPWQNRRSISEGHVSIRGNEVLRRDEYGG